MFKNILVYSSYFVICENCQPESKRVADISFLEFNFLIKYDSR
jgi:hypothetical protein